MTKEMLMEFLEGYEDGEQVCEQDLARFYQDVADAQERMVEEIEERQYASGFYAFQDSLDMMRRER